PSASAGSRLTGLPARRLPRLVRSSVSADRSAEKPCSSMASAVRQQPATDTLSPSRHCAGSSRGQSIRMRQPPEAGVILLTRPTDWTIPVNITAPLSGDKSVQKAPVLDKATRFDQLDMEAVVEFFHPRQIQQRSPAPDQTGRLIDQQLIDQPLRRQRAAKG